MKITGDTKIVGILGDPVSHSLSPLMQNAAFKAMGLNICYVPLHVRPEELGAAVNGLRAMDFIGANVTIPHKIEVTRYLDKLDTDAAIIGAVNTIVNIEGELSGHNTDGSGFIRALEDEVVLEYSSETAVIMGAGGAARSVGVALARKGIRGITILNRSKNRAQEFCLLFAENFPELAVSYKTFDDDYGEVIRNSKILINATPIGMKGYLKGPSGVVDKITKDHVVCDLVYLGSEETPLQIAANKKEATSMGGIGMLLYQGAEAINLWTGKKPPIKIMRHAIEIE